MPNNLKQRYWGVECEECDSAVPVLEYEPDMDRRNPDEFEATCLKCQSKHVYVESDLGVHRLLRIPAFIPFKGFSNSERPD